MKKNSFIVLIVAVIILSGFLIYTGLNLITSTPNLDEKENDNNLSQPINTSYVIEAAFPNISFDRPVGIYSANEGSNRLFVIGQKGLIYVFENNETTNDTSIFLNITDRVLYGGEQGLLGLAFHPLYNQNGYFYVNYVKDNPRRTIISRFTLNSSDPNLANSSSEQIILEVLQPFSNHNGGQLAFGPDNYLYIALGDGGSGGDPLNHGQNRSTLLGSLLRIDIDSGTPYSIPLDNPFVGNSEGYREEIYAYGLRNPWRFSFDKVTNRLWLADVGQGAWEEIDIIESGKNYGWNIMEGDHCYNSISCNTIGLESPIFEYDHSVGSSITGGFVYRGSKLDALEGSYIYGDFVTGKIWALTYQPDAETYNELLVDTALLISSFGIDESNELYICAFDGKIYTINT